MKELSQKQLIIKYLKEVWIREGQNYAWVRAYNLRGKHTNYGFLGHQADRRARELAKDGKIEARIKDSFAEYRFIPPPPEKTGIERAKELAEMGFL